MKPQRKLSTVCKHDINSDSDRLGLLEGPPKPLDPNNTSLLPLQWILRMCYDPSMIPYRDKPYKKTSRGTGRPFQCPEGPVAAFIDSGRQTKGWGLTGVQLKSRLLKLSCVKPGNARYAESADSRLLMDIHTCCLWKSSVIQSAEKSISGVCAELWPNDINNRRMKLTFGV